MNESKDISSRIAGVIQVGGDAISELHLGRWWMEGLIRERMDKIAAGYVVLPHTSDMTHFMGIPVHPLQDEYGIDVT